jgi:4-amino-4-deoxychorismate lyase
MSEILGSWVDGVPGTTVPLDDRGLQYGDGLFETMLVGSGRVRFLDSHLARLAHGCERLGIPLAVDAALRAEIQRAAAAARAPAVLKLIVTRGSGPRGYAPRGAFAARRVMTLFATSPAGVTAEGVSLRVARQTASENPALAGLKHLNRLENVLACQEPQHEACFDALLLDSAGQLVGGTMSNLFICRGGRVLTPRVDRAGVAGVMRGIVLREGGTLGFPVEERPIAGAELAMADEAFVTNARIGVVPVRNVGEHVFRMNEIGARLAAHIGTLDA